MFRTLLICTVISGCAAACTSSPASRADSKSATAANPVPINCVKTGSRIHREDDGCSNLPGRSYSQDDIDRTGQTNAADALRMLDPSITSGHH